MQDPLAATRSPSPASYALAVSDLTTPQIDAELSRLALSEQKLISTNETLSSEEWKEEDFAREAIRENEELLSSYVWRRGVIREELEKRGLSEHGMTEQGQGQGEGIEL